MTTTSTPRASRPDDPNGPDIQGVGETVYPNGEDIQPAAGQPAGSKPKAEIAALADGEKLNREAQADALAWLLEPEEDDETLMPQEHFRVNVSTDRSAPRFIDWTIQGISSSQLQRLRAETQRGRGGKNARNNPAMEQAIQDEINLKIVLSGTVIPSFQAAANRQNTSPLTLIKVRFQRKPFLIDQLVGKILSLSGMDEDDVVSADEEIERAAGN